ncbi:MAG TPA: transketolase [Flavobacteriales bacterium]|nr:transketolase [Flavobacteriales bacterium]
MAEIQEMKAICSQVRRDIVRMVHRVQSGHPGGSLGAVEYFVALYFEIMKYDAKNFSMEGKNEDLFFLSNGHISPVWYSTLSFAGFFEREELNTFRILNSRLQGHPATEEGLPGIRVASGSLGQGMSVAIGAAMAKKLDGDDRIVYTLHGDGEMQEGQIWEAAMAAAFHKVDNLISTIDCNNRQIDGDVDETMNIDSLEDKFKSFNWDVMHMDVANIENVVATLKEAKSKSGQGKPIVILMKTEMGQGVDFMMGSHKWHGIPPNDEQLANALGQLEETYQDY